MSSSLCTYQFLLPRGSYPAISACQASSNSVRSDWGSLGERGPVQFKQILFSYVLVDDLYLCILSIYLSIYLPTYLPTYLSIYLPTYLPIYLSLYLESISISLYIFISISIYIYLSISIYLYIYICVCVCLCALIYLRVFTCFDFILEG